MASGIVPAGKDTGRSEEMIEQEMANQDLGSVGRRFTNPSGGRWFWLLLEVQEEAMAAAPSRTHEDAAIEVEDVLSQADEALVLG